MKKQLISGNFSSVPLATLIASTLDVAAENEVRDDEAPTENRNGEQDPPAQ